MGAAWEGNAIYESAFTGCVKERGHNRLILRSVSRKEISFTKSYTNIAFQTWKLFDNMTPPKKIKLFVY